MCLLLVPGFQGFFFMWPLTVLMKQARQAVYAIEQSIYLDVYEKTAFKVHLQNGPKMRLCHPPDGSTSPKYKLLCFKLP